MKFFSNKRYADIVKNSILYKNMICFLFFKNKELKINNKEFYEFCHSNRKFNIVTDSENIYFEVLE